ncbi:uncharacterized protein BJ212DRAFT_1299310 [Suillus subaureus]|uniref:Uncharacterized protein n=1 Tax=Suillus subaureus TaxID=48587 RepID=A0A9P7EC41_9AGAM|nr:uncharacterized protein BJ212DRAFT_1299310 [Suillus subaureus]KAG1817142.1 hypothetical protein BJ212DRAFT_1299310 [Suillus subaureus]
MSLSSAITPHTVLVPIRDGVETVTTIPQLQVTHCVISLDQISLSHLQDGFVKCTISLRTFPWAALECTFFRKHPLIHALPNALIPGVTANVLLVKRVRGTKHKVVDCGEEDMPWVNRVVRQIRRRTLQNGISKGQRNVLWRNLHFRVISIILLQETELIEGVHCLLVENCDNIQSSVESSPTVGIANDTRYTRSHAFLTCFRGGFSGLLHCTSASFRAWTRIILASII